MSAARGAAQASGPMMAGGSATRATSRASGGRVALSERDFQRQVTDLAEILGWQWAHFRPAQTSRGWRTPVSGPLGAGWPDLILVRARDRRLIFAELKRDGAKPSPAQVAVLAVLDELGHCMCGRPDCLKPKVGPQVEVHVWHPADFDVIAETLR